MVHKIFDKNMVVAKRNQIAANYKQYEFILQELISNFSLRLEETRNNFMQVLDLGCHHGQISELTSLKSKSSKIIQAETSINMANIARKINPNIIVIDEEILPFKNNSFDLVLSALMLHMVNDVPGLLVQIKNILKPGGLLLAGFFGENHLIEFRQVMAMTELELNLPVCLHTFPLIDMKTVGSLMQRAGFALPVIDKLSITVEYSSLKQLVQDLDGMGQIGLINNIIMDYPEYFWDKAQEIMNYKFPANDKSFNITFEILVVTGLKL